MVDAPGVDRKATILTTSITTADLTTVDTSLDESSTGDLVPVWTNECLRCHRYSVWLLEDATHATGWGDHHNFAWKLDAVPFGSSDHEIALWNHSFMWDEPKVPRATSGHDECWVALGYWDAGDE